ncbi:MAG: hypothetical protein KAU83_09390 [Bacteroidales bacterium]|nr:hypothetical protein [Bacteroidales bacterium]
MKNKTTIYWILAVLITLAAAYYQRKTGPTYPKEFDIYINQSSYHISLLRTHGGDENFPVELEIPDTSIYGKIFFKRYPTNDDWQSANLKREGDFLLGFLPHQPPAGKLAYYLQIFSRNETIDVPKESPVVIRFKGNVPTVILVPHVFFMFFAMLLSTLATLLAFGKHRRFRFYGNITLVALFIGGLILGPMVQYHAFGDAWTGIPFGWDLTDNKTLISFLVWLMAVVANRKKERPAFTILAGVVLLLIYSIPHSMFGSEFDFSTGEITQGFIHLM